MCFFVFLIVANDQVGLWWLWKVLLLIWLILSCYLLDCYGLSFIAADDRLGHREQKDEWVPRCVDVFTRHNVLPPDAVVSAGSANSSCTAGRIRYHLATAISILFIYVCFYSSLFDIV